MHIKAILSTKRKKVDFQFPNSRPGHNISNFCGKMPNLPNLFLILLLHPFALGEPLGSLPWSQWSCSGGVWTRGRSVTQEGGRCVGEDRQPCTPHMCEEGGVCCRDNSICNVSTGGRRGEWSTCLCLRGRWGSCKLRKM